MAVQTSYSATNPPMAYTADFYNFVQNWDVVIVWDKDHTMVDPHNILRPHMEEVILGLLRDFPSWRHVVLTENSMDSVMELFDTNPSLRSVFNMVLCEDNYFSKKAIRSFFRKQGLPFAEFGLFWSQKVRKERTRRKRRRVNDLFLGKKVVLIDDLRDGRIPEHSFCVACKVWTGEPTHQDEVSWPLKIRKNTLRVLRNLYRYQEPEMIGTTDARIVPSLPESGGQKEIGAAESGL